MGESNKLLMETRYNLVLKIAQAIYSSERGRKEIRMEIPTDDRFVSFHNHEYNDLDMDISMDYEDECFIKDYNYCVGKLQENFGIIIPKIEMQVSFYCGSDKIGE